MENSIKQNNVKKVINIVLNVLFYLFIVLLFVFAISNIRGKKNNIPNIFGYGYLTVNSNSMRGDAKDCFEKGDIIVVNIASQKEIDNIKIGDIVTFEDLQMSKTFDDMGVSAAEQKSLTNLNTHRIVDIKETDGTKYFIAQGDYIKYPHTSDPNDPYDFSYDYTADIYTAHNVSQDGLFVSTKDLKNYALSTLMKKVVKKAL